jgi:hypothetical protein
MMLLPLTKRESWNFSQIQDFWEISKIKTRKILKKYTDVMLVSSYELNGKNSKRYLINSFMWYLSEFEFPRVTIS